MHDDSRAVWWLAGGILALVAVIAAGWHFRGAGYPSQRVTQTPAAAQSAGVMAGAESSAPAAIRSADSEVRSEPALSAGNEPVPERGPAPGSAGSSPMSTDQVSDGGSVTATIGADSTAWVASESVTDATGTARSGGQVYQCMQDGHKVFSDQRCGPDARTQAISVSNQMSAREAAIHYQAAPPGSTASRARRSASDADVDTERITAQCAALQRDKDRINSRMRASYTNNEGERLRARLRRIDSEYYDLRCRDFK